MDQNQIRYGVTNPIILKNYCKLRAAIKSPNNYIKSLKKDPTLQTAEVSAIMCVWDEKENVEKAILSSHELVTRYIVVDKNGDTIPTIKKIQDDLDLDIECYTKPKLNLKESRKFALDQIKSEWILIQDGDEIFNNATGEPNSIYNLRKYMVFPNVIIKSRMNVLKLDYLHTQPINNAHHAFLLHNNGDIHFGKADIPRGKGRVINLKPIYKFNLSSIKPIDRLYYRHKYWKMYERSGLSNEYSTIQEYVNEYLKIQVTGKDLTDYEKILRKSVIPYNKTVQGELPKILRDLVSNGIIK